MSVLGKDVRLDTARFSQAPHRHDREEAVSVGNQNSHVSYVSALWLKVALSADRENFPEPSHGSVLSAIFVIEADEIEGDMK